MGLGSNVSICAGPPSMYRKNDAFGFGRMMRLRQSGRRVLHGQSWEQCRQTQCPKAASSLAEPLTPRIARSQATTWIVHNHLKFPILLQVLELFSAHQNVRKFAELVYRSISDQFQTCVHFIWGWLARESYLDHGGNALAVIAVHRADALTPALAVSCTSGAFSRLSACAGTFDMLRLPTVVAGGG